MTGLGVTTVSRALSDAPDIAEATKERVRLVAKQIGYRPNRAGVRLRTGKTNVISLILDLRDEAFDLTPGLVFGLSETLADTPYHLIVTPYDTEGDALAPVRYVVETGSADGVILSRTEPDDARVRYLHEHGMPFATHGRTDMGIDHPYCDFDNEAYARLAVDLLAARGRQRLALIGAPPQLMFARHTSVGFEQALEQYDLMEIPVHGATIDSQSFDIETEVFRLMRSRYRPDGFVCSAPTAAIAVTAGIERAGLIVGEDVDIVGKQSFDFLKKFRPGILVINEDFRSAGRTLADAITRTIAGTSPLSLQTLEVPVAPLMADESQQAAV